MNYRLFRRLILPLYLGLIFSVGGIPVSAQNIGERPTISEYLTRRLAGVQKQVQLDGRKYDVRLKLDALCPVYSQDAALRSVARSVLGEYGAIFVGDSNVFLDFEVLSSNGNVVSLVSQCVFLDEAGVQRYQSRVNLRREVIGGSSIELEENAMAALMDARKQAAAKGLNITPRGGSIAARRSYADTQRLWESRLNPGLRRWAGKKLSPQEVGEIRRMTTVKQVAQILEWEDKKQAFFSTDFSKSIMYSVAPPGTSQHLFMLAIDIEQYSRKDVRDILASNGWYQTVKSDLPHFTYLGIKDRSELLKRGLKREEINGHEFWTTKVD